jgi:dipeptidyl aminopeptidase/acylaminoacyl peptidase
MHRTLQLGILLILLLSTYGCGQRASSAGAPTPAVQATAASRAATPVGEDLGMLAYVHQGDLWIRQLPNGSPRRLTSSGDVSAPRWSPSGAWLLYCAGDQLRIIKVLGKDNRQLGPCDGAWSPRADVLVHMTGSGASIVTPGEWRERPLPEQATLWSPDGTALAFVREQPQASQRAANDSPRSASLWRIAADGRRVVIYAPAPSEDGMILAAWPGAHILFWSDPLFSASLLADGVPLWEVPSAGGQPHELAPATLAYLDFLALSSDSQRIALVVGAGRETWADKRIAVADLNGGELAYLTGATTAAVSPDWSPDDRRIAFAAAADGGPLDDDDAAAAAIAQRRIWAMRPDGSDKRQLTRDPAYRDERPRWSADGRHLLFVRVDKLGRAGLWLMRADGGDLARVADDLGPFPDAESLALGYYGHVSWEAGFDWWRGPASKGGAE